MCVFTLKMQQSSFFKIHYAMFDFAPMVKILQLHTRSREMIFFDFCRKKSYNKYFHLSVSSIEIIHKFYLYIYI